jgi:hypothetical protein
MLRLLDCSYDLQNSTCSLILVYLFLGLPFDPEDGRSAFLEKVGELRPDYMASIPEDNIHF